MHNRPQRFLDKDGLIEYDAGLQLLRNIEQPADQVADTIDYFDGVGVAPLLHDGDVTGTLAIDADDVVLDLTGVFGFSHIAHRHPARPGRLERNVVELLDALHHGVGVDVVVVGADLYVSGGQNQVVLVDGIDHVHHAQLPGKQFEGIDVDHDLPVLASKRRWDLGAFHHGDLVTDLELRKVV